MKEAFSIVALIFIVTFTIMFITGYKYDHVAGKSWNGYETGKCYVHTITKENPFSTKTELLKYIIDINGEYYQYQWWLGIGLGYSSKSSDKFLWLTDLNYIETPCPKQFWIF